MEEEAYDDNVFSNASKCGDNVWTNDAVSKRRNEIGERKKERKKEGAGNRERESECENGMRPRDCIKTEKASGRPSPAALATARIAGSRGAHTGEGAPFPRQHPA